MDVLFGTTVDEDDMGGFVDASDAEEFNINEEIENEYGGAVRFDHAPIEQDENAGFYLIILGEILTIIMVLFGGFE